MAKNETFEDGTFESDGETVQFTRIIKTVRKKDIYSYKINQQITLGVNALEDFIANARKMAEGLEDVFISVDEQRMVLEGTRPATEEEIETIEASIREEYERVQLINAKREERLISQLRELRPDLIKEDA